MILFGELNECRRHTATNKLDSYCVVINVLLAVFKARLVGVGAHTHTHTHTHTHIHVLYYIHQYILQAGLCI